MTPRRILAAVGAVATLTATAVIGVLAHGTPASAHGAMMIPGSRTYLCYEDGLTDTGAIVPKNPACAAAVAQSGTTGLYNWFAVLRSDGAGRTQGFIPDGKLCSADSPNYDFSGFDLPRTDWPMTHLTSGATMQIRYNKWAAHPGTFTLYVSKPGVDLSQPLGWDDFDLTNPFSTAVQPPSVGSPGSVDSYYYWDATFPSGRSGRAVVYSVWSRSDSTETFYGCSDVTFDGGNGEVTGVGDGTPPTDPTTSPPTDPGDPSACMASFALTNTWNGGYQADVTVMNHGDTPMSGWTVRWTVPAGDTVDSVWNGTLSRDGTTVTVRNEDWNRTIPVDGTTSFGLTGTGPAAVPTLTCTSP